MTMEMTPTQMQVWRAYRIDDKGDLQAALSAFGKKPTRILVSTKAPEWLVALVKEVDAEIEPTQYLLPQDIWLGGNQ